ncbi:MAG TPA: hypothetical protein PL047_09645 [Methanothrix sp.]|nr:hypothetical protein [Methanothrix sp.]
MAEWGKQKLELESGLEPGLRTRLVREMGLKIRRRLGMALAARLMTGTEMKMGLGLEL